MVTFWVGAAETDDEPGWCHQVEQTAFEPVDGTTGTAQPSPECSCPERSPVGKRTL